MPHGTDGDDKHHFHLYMLANARNLLCEGFGAAVLAFAVAVGGALPGLAPLGAALGAAIAVTTMTDALLWRTGAMLTPGGVLTHVLGSIFRLMPRNYFFSPSLIAGHDHLWTPAVLIFFDVLFGVLYCAAQFGGAVAGIAAARGIDKAGLIKASVHTAPFAGLAGENNWALLLAFLLNMFVLLLCIGLKAGAFGDRWAQLSAPRSVGLAMAGGVLASYVLGAGTTLSFFTDLALALLITKDYSPMWWISGCGQLCGAVVAFSVAWVMAQADQLALRHSKHDAKALAHMHPMHRVASHHHDGTLGHTIDDAAAATASLLHA